MNDSQKGYILGMFTVTATAKYSLLRNAVHMCYGQMDFSAQEMPRSFLVVHVLITDVDVPVLTLEKSMAGAADLSKCSNTPKKSKSKFPLFQ
jgi:hypothetical protein